jgi:hypothetical protein
MEATDPTRPTIPVVEEVRVNVALETSTAPLPSTTNAHVTGTILVDGAATFVGNVSVGGVLTADQLDSDITLSPVLATGGSSPKTLAAHLSRVDVDGGPIPVLATGTTVPRSMADIAGDTINLKAVGCACNGASNDYAALVALIASIGSSYVTVVVPDRCHTDTSVTFHPNTTLRFEGRGCFTGSVVKYSGLAVYSAGGVLGGQVGSHAPWAFGSYQSGAAPGSDQYLNDVLFWKYNADPANGDAKFSTSHCSWVEQTETHFGGYVMTLGFEKHWTYVSADGLTSYRPMNFGVDYATHTASLNWLLGQWSIRNRLATSNPVLFLDTTIGAERFWFQPADNSKVFNIDALGNVSVGGYINAPNGVIVAKRLTGSVAVLPYSASITPEPNAGMVLTLGVTDANAFTVNVPSGGLGTGRIFTIIISNLSGGAMYASSPFVGGYRTAAWVAPAPGYRVAITFVDVGNIIEISRVVSG